MNLKMVGFFVFLRISEMWFVGESFQGAERETFLRRRQGFGGERESGTQVVQA
jgi:hypothetical protein